MQLARAKDYRVQGWNGLPNQDYHAVIFQYPSQLEVGTSPEFKILWDPVL